MTHAAQIVLSYDTWQRLGESLLSALPEVKNMRTEVIIVPSYFDVCEAPMDKAHLHCELERIQARLQTRYPHLTFNYEHIIEYSNV